MKLKILLPILTFFAAYIGALANGIGDSNWYDAVSYTHLRAHETN